MSTFKVNVKHNKRTYKDVALDTAQPAAAFKAQVYALTKVPPGAQKILVKGGQLKDDHDWAKLRLKDGHQFIVMGKPEDVAAPQAPAQKTVFLEDLPEEQRGGSAAGAYLPNGLANLGNTCYMNSVIQCFRSVPELKKVLKVYNPSGSDESADAALAAALKNVMIELDDEKLNRVVPFALVNRLRLTFPQFNEQVNGHYAQQDAEECWTSMISSLKRSLPPQPVGGGGGGGGGGCDGDGGEVAKASPVEAFFEGEFTVRRRNTELTEDVEPPTTATQSFVKLRLPIASDSRYINECLKESMRSVMDKQSDVAGRNCQYEEISLIKKLPFYLTLQFVRFRWKAATGVNTEGNKAKVLRPVEFPLTLDMYQWCDPDLQKDLQVGRSAMKEIEDRKISLGGASTKKKAKTDNDNNATNNDSTNNANENAASTAVAMETDGGSGAGAVDNDPLKDIEMPATVNLSYKNDTGVYDLHALVTHKGRDADGGHYVAWVKDGPNRWLLFDDEDVSVVDDEAIKKLAGTGGADWHIAYVMVYKARNVKIIADEARSQLKSDAAEEAKL